jgi:hypothetical protein
VRLCGASCVTRPGVVQATWVRHTACTVCTLWLCLLLHELTASGWSHYLRSVMHWLTSPLLVMQLYPHLTGWLCAQVCEGFGTGADLAAVTLCMLKCVVGLSEGVPELTDEGHYNSSHGCFSAEGSWRRVGWAWCGLVDGTLCCPAKSAWHGIPHRISVVCALRGQCASDGRVSATTTLCGAETAGDIATLCIVIHVDWLLGDGYCGDMLLLFARCCQLLQNSGL